MIWEAGGLTEKAKHIFYVDKVQWLQNNSFKKLSDSLQFELTVQLLHFY